MLAHLAPVLLLPQSELDVRVTQSVGVHGNQIPAFDERDADDPSPELGFPMLLRETRRLLLLDHTHTQVTALNVRGYMRGGGYTACMCILHMPALNELLFICNERV